jgi:8-oxo-dGTP pyrophosphatase MutT (NUDIX family)
MLSESLVDDARLEGIEKFVVGAVIHHDGLVLIVTRSASDDFLPGIEELPSGGVERDETLAEGLDRELLEEVGLRAHPMDSGFIACFDYTSGSGRPTRQLTVSVPLMGRRIELSEEHSAHRWIRCSDLDHASVTAETKTVLHKWFAWASRSLSE